jgi:hypothetical protein
MAIGSATTAEIGKSDPIITRLAAEDKKYFFQKPNLFFLYLMLFPTCMGIELTSGFDSQMINALQIVPKWKECTSQLPAFFSMLGDTRANRLVSRLPRPAGCPQGHYCRRLLPWRYSVASHDPIRQ